MDGVGYDDERGIVALRRYYALRHEAEDTLTASKRIWTDTPFSLYALQEFEPPTNPEGMQALLEHSVQNYGPLPSELGPRRVRSRTGSRASPYQRTSPGTVMSAHRVFVASAKQHPLALQAVEVNSNVYSYGSPAGRPPKHKRDDAGEVYESPAVLSPSKRSQFGGPPNARPRVASAARRTALGWAKRSTKASTEQKENNNTSATGISFMMTCVYILRWVCGY
jgi:hypothetical protein